MNTEFLSNAKKLSGKKMPVVQKAKLSVAQKTKLIEDADDSAQSLTLEILTLDDMTDFLTELQTKASECAKATLKAQLQVIDFVKSRSLVDTTLDKLMSSMASALKYAGRENNESEARERFSLMIKNYVLFLNARLQLEFNRDKAEASRMYEEAGEMLGKSVKDVAIMATPAETVDKMEEKLVIQNVFMQESPKTLGYEYRRSFKVLHNIILKLDKYRDTIGSSAIIANIIKQYVPDIVKDAYAQELSNKQNSIKKAQEKLEQQPLFFSSKSTTYTVLGLGGLTILLRWIWYGLCSIGSTVISWFSDDYSATDHAGWFFPHLLWVLGIAAVIEGICVINSYSKRQAISEEIEEAERQYDQKVSESNDFEKSLNEIANKFN